MRNNRGRTTVADQLPRLLTHSDTLRISHKDDPLFFVKDQEIIDLCKKMFAEDQEAERIYIRCEQASPIVADRSIGSIQPSGMRFIPDGYCKQFEDAFGVLSPRLPPREEEGRRAVPLWARFGAGMERWRRKRLSDSANMILDSGLAFTVTTVAPVVAPLFGARFVTAVKTENRLTICRACDRYRNGICIECGCVTHFKARLDGGACPIGKW